MGRCELKMNSTTKKCGYTRTQWSYNWKGYMSKRRRGEEEEEEEAEEEEKDEEEEKEKKKKMTGNTTL